MVNTLTSSFLRGNRAVSVGRLETLYPSPFFDVATQYLPNTIKETFDWCLYYQLTNPLISAVTNKMATYPVTDLVYESDNEGEVNNLRGMFEGPMNLSGFVVETNLDRVTFGNSFASVAFPILKILECPGCGHRQTAKKASYVWQGYKYRITCKKCDGTYPAKVHDEPIKAPSRINLIRWNPKQITVKTNEITGTSSYYYKIPTILRNQIVLGKPEVIEEIPKAFIEAVAKNKTIKIDSNKIFHSKRPSPSRDAADNGWGAPLILPVLKDIFFLQVLRKSQEAVALEHIVPMRIMFPQVSAEGNNPYSMTNLQSWQNEVMTQIGKWRQDCNHIAVMPVPMGQQTLGGQGKSMLLHQEIRMYSEQIIAGMGVPTGFFYGEAQYSGASINLKALENEFMGNRRDMLMLVEFIRDQVCTFLGLPRTPVSFKPFKMADDLQRAAFDMQQVQGKLLSQKTFSQSRDRNYEVENELIMQEAIQEARIIRQQTISNAEAQGEASLKQAKYQAKIAEMQRQAGIVPEGEGQPGEPGQQQAQGQQESGYAQAQGVQSPMTAQTAAAGGNNVELGEQVQAIVKSLQGMEQVDRYKKLTELRRSQPQLYTMVNAALGGGGAPGATLAPLPTMTTSPG